MPPTPPRPEPSELARRAAAKALDRGWDFASAIAFAALIDAAAEELAADEALGPAEEA